MSKYQEQTKVRFQMKALVISLILLIGGFYISGCVSIGSATFPEPDKGFQPKTEYPISLDTLWNAVRTTLLTQRINITSSDKSGGNINTYYVQGPTQLNLVPGMPSLNTRYKYNITIQNVDAARSKLTVICTLESSSEAMAWHDVSQDNKERVTDLENWLYEQIDKSL